MRNRLTKQAMGKDDSPTTMHVEQMNPDVSKYETGNPSEWAEDVHRDMPWKQEKREETGHPSMKGASKNVYADAVKEAQELEAKALHCLKIAEVMLGGDAPADAVERQAVDFMTMSNKSVLATLRRMREFEEAISEARVAKIVDAVLEVIAEEEEEEKKEASEEEVVEAALETVNAEEKEEEEKKEAKEEKEEEEEKKEASTDDIVSQVTAAVLAALKSAEEHKEEEKKEAEEEMKEEKEEEKKEAEEEEKEAKEDEEVKEAEEEEKEAKEDEEVKEAEEEHKEEEMKEEKEEEHKEEEMKEATSNEITFEEGADVLASDEDAALLSQLFTTKEADEEKGSEKEAKIKSLKNVTASSSLSEIDKLSSLWNKDL